MPSQATENYLKALYYLYSKNPEISLTELGQRLEVSKPTVNEMIKRLEKQGWVTYERYKPISLTEEGKKAAALVIRKHRLSEMFLSEIMGFGWEEVHQIAEQIEHLKSDIFFDRMNEMLGFPTSDPHGSPIPDREGNFIVNNYKILSQIAEGKTVELKALRSSDKEFLMYLNKKEIRLGSVITVNNIEKFDKSMTVSYGKQTNVILSQPVAAKLLVDLIS
ncbi:metal-dependent transcriptional regulator [Arenibacter certesii]|uniref:Transcriptional regulator MntR n=1 Tax=Arenibacter certesii TaxID=228955 RepID=A0A918J4D2_9FLAO|nr:metal-dependent transcriptional regulator [Arenibacter certesii]GGW46263.1 iron-dependent repressor [Arenibacter certesii]